MFFALNDVFFWLSFLYFILGVFVAFFIPGDTVLYKFKFPLFQRIVLGTLIGMALWIWQGFIFGFLNIGPLTYLYMAVFLALWVVQNKQVFRSSIPKKIKLKPDYLLVLIIALGVFVQVLTVWFTGVKISDGVFFCCGNIGDSLKEF